MLHREVVLVGRLAGSVDAVAVQVGLEQSHLVAAGSRRVPLTVVMVEGKI